MAKDIKSHFIGKEGENIARYLLNLFSRVNEFDDDIGLDFYCEIRGDEVNKFSIQAKGSESPVYSNGDIYSEYINCETIRNYWLTDLYPVFVIMSNTYLEETYYIHVSADTFQPASITQKEYRFLIPNTNLITKENLGTFIADIIAHQPNVSLSTADRIIADFKSRHPNLFHSLDEIDSLLEYLRSSDQDLQVHAKKEINRLYEDPEYDSIRLVRGLIEIFRSCKDRITQHHVLDSIVNTGSREVIPEVVKQLERNLLLYDFNLTIPAMRHTYILFLFDALVKLEAKDVYSDIARYLGYGEVSLVRGLLSYCGRLKLSDSISDIKPFLDHHEKAIREEAARSFAMIGTRDVVKLSREIISKGRSDLEISSAINIAGMMKEHSLKKLVLGKSTSPSLEIRAAICKYIGLIDAQDCIHVLLDCISSTNKEVFKEAMNSLLFVLSLSDSDKEDIGIELLERTFKSSPAEYRAALTIIDNSAIDKCGERLVAQYNEMASTKEIEGGEIAQEWRTREQDLRWYLFDILVRHDTSGIRDIIIKQVKEDSSCEKSIRAASQLKLEEIYNELVGEYEQRDGNRLNSVLSAMNVINRERALNWAKEKLETIQNLKTKLKYIQIVQRPTGKEDLDDLVYRCIVEMISDAEIVRNPEFQRLLGVWKVRESIDLIAGNMDGKEPTFNNLYGHLRLLSEIGTRDAIEVIAKALPQVEDRLKIEVLKFIGNSSYEGAETIIRGYLGYNDYYVQKAAGESLARWNTSRDSP